MPDKTFMPCWQHFCCRRRNCISTVNICGAISEELGLSVDQKATLGSAVFLGQLVGNFACSGMDSFGRRKPILVALLGILVFIGASAMATNFLTIAVLWILAGFSVGIGIPNFNALTSEVSPAKWRFLLNAVSQTLFPLGSLHAACLVYRYAPDLASIGQHWRRIILIERLPNLIFLVLGVLPGFVESPHYLAAYCGKQEAKQQLEIMASQNGIPLTCPDFDVEKTPSGSGSSSVFQRVGTLFGRHLWATTVAVSFTTFMLNFITFGSMYTLPTVLSEVDLGMSPAMSLVVATLFDASGFLTGFALERVAKHKTLLVTY